MARRPTLRQQINSLLDKYDDEIRDAFLDSINEITSRVVLKTLVEHLKNREIDKALAALNIEAAAFAKLEGAIAQAYNAGGTAMVGHLPTLRDANGAAAVIRFDIRNPRAENWLRTHSSTLITRIMEDQQTGIRRVLETGMAQGTSPNRVGLDIVGRINKLTGRREGGLVGLTGQQMDYVASARDELTSGDTAAYKKYLTRGRRDKRFDRSVLKAIRDEKPLDAATTSRMMHQYKNSLLKLRGETIGRTEALASVNAAKHEGFAQGLDKTNVSVDQVTRTWSSAGDGKVRHSHAAMDGQVVIGLDTPFVTPTGERMMHPGDASLGAGADQVINCRCIANYKIDFFEGRG